MAEEEPTSYGGPESPENAPEGAAPASPEPAEGLTVEGVMDGSALLDKSSGWSGMFSRSKTLSEKAADKRKEAAQAAKDAQDHKEAHDRAPAHKKEAAKAKLEAKEKKADDLAHEAAMHDKAVAVEQSESKVSTLQKLFGVITCGCISEESSKKVCKHSKPDPLPLAYQYTAGFPRHFNY